MSTEPEHLSPTTAALAPLRGGAIVTPAVQAAQALEAQQAYRQLCEALLDASDYQKIGDRDFRKKSGWRKLAVAFNVSNEIISREYERDGHGRIVRAEVVDRATAPNGRTTDGLGACDLFEKCCVKATCRVRSQYHTHCDEMAGGCDGTRHFSNPQHDIPATAATRARNRACADLFGMGEVSAEEITNPTRGDYEGRDSGDQRSWWEANGWDEEAEERAAHQGLIDRLKAMPEEAKLSFGEQRRAANIDLQKPLTRAQFGQLVKIADSLEPPPAKAARTAPGGTDEPEAAAEAQPAAGAHEAAPEGQEAPQEAGQPGAEATDEEILERVNAMPLEEVDRLLRLNALEATGRQREKRVRLGRFWIERKDAAQPPLA